MSKERILEFDYIRVVCLIGILVCHSLLDYWYSYEWLGRLLGMTFNFLFLILSAFLFGLSWESKGCPSHKVVFLKKRMLKLSRSYYPYLVLLFLLLYFSQGYFSPRKIVSHVIYLPWFDKIEGFGHLWFMTMIVLCYVGCVVVTRKFLKDISIAVWAIMAVIAIILDYLVSVRGLPGYIFPYLVGYMFVFRYSRRILDAVRSIRITNNLIQFILITGVNFVVFRIYNLDPYSFVSYLLGIIQALSVFCLMYDLCRNVSYSKVIIFISGISFEVYLVHEFFLGHYSVYKYIHQPIVSVTVFVLLSVVTGYLLNLLSKFIAQRSSKA